MVRSFSRHTNTPHWIDIESLVWRVAVLGRNNRANAEVTKIAEPYLVGKASASRTRFPDCSFWIGARIKSYEPSKFADCCLNWGFLIIKCQFKFLNTTLELKLQSERVIIMNVWWAHIFIILIYHIFQIIISHTILRISMKIYQVFLRSCVPLLFEIKFDEMIDVETV
jgi:hypothetical protein